MDGMDDDEPQAKTSQRPAPSSGGGHRRSVSAGLAARYLGSVGGAISLVSSSPTLNGRVGLVNLGNTCFMNAALQCLSHTSHFTKYFLQGEWQKDLNTKSVHGSGGALCREYAALTKQLWHSSKEAVAPVSFKNVLSHYAPQFEGYAQHDAQELAIFLLDGLHEDLNRISGKKPYVEDVETGDQSDEEAAAEAWGNHLRRDTSVVVDTFQGQLKSTVRCAECGYASSRFDPFMYLSLPLPSHEDCLRSPPTLKRCLEAFMEEEQLSADNMWRCPKCKDFRSASKQLRIWKLPSHLMIHLKRFGGHASASDFRKRTEKVETSLDSLDLSDFVGDGTKRLAKYELYAVCNHMGSVAGGHYTAYVRHALDKMEWLAFNDARCSPISPKEVISEDNYLLFFRKNLQGPPLKQSVSKPENWPFEMTQIPARFRIEQQRDAMRSVPASRRGSRSKSPFVRRTLSGRRATAAAAADPAPAPALAQPV